MSWNATGIMTGIPYLCKELVNENVTICGLSEHWLLQHNSYILDAIDSNYSSHVVCVQPNYLNGRQLGRGGVALLWHKSINQYVRIIDVNCDRLAVIKLCLPDISLLVVQVYLPSVNHSIDYFKQIVDELADICSVHAYDSNLVLMGDYNARFTSQSMAISQRTRDTYICNFAKERCLKVLTTSDICKGAQCSFYPYTSASPSLIDHILVDELLYRHITDCVIKPDAPLNVSRHLPVFMTICIQPILTVCSNLESFTRTRYKWNRYNEIKHYEQELSRLLQSHSLGYKNTDDTYDKIVACLISASESTISKRKFCKFLKPFWSNALKESHEIMRKSRWLWVTEGKPRNSASYYQYKQDKCAFRRNLRAAAHQYEQEEFERIDKLSELDQKGFWKVVNSKKPKRKTVGLEMVFNGRRETTPDNILNGWQGYFQSLYTPSDEENFDNEFKTTIDANVRSYLQNKTMEGMICDNTLTSRVTYDELDDIIKTLPNNKSASIGRVTLLRKAQ